MAPTLAAVPPVLADTEHWHPDVPATRAVPGHDRWHPDIPPVAEVITGGSVRLECERARPGEEPVLCGPLAVVGAEPGDVIVVDVVGMGRSDGVYAPYGHPGVIGCAPAAGSLRPPHGRPAAGARLGRIEPGHPAYPRVAAESIVTRARGRDVGGCGIAPLGPGARILLPVHVRGAKLSAGDLHFPESGAADCRTEGRAGWIDLRVNLTRQGVARFGVAGPLLMTGPT
ncbi:acetamidase/formamidase family protein [Actinomadura sp. 21ATH]|uniref:acetamidase/formamidase family protein n=1 Tax=Actinomadura sp. 21ATH TaxID=1735444 RepID=UPI0035C161BF